jgi:hypothetical protein
MTRGNAESVYLDEAFDASVGTIITSSYATIPGSTLTWAASVHNVPTPPSLEPRVGGSPEGAIAIQPVTEPGLIAR